MGVFEFTVLLVTVFVGGAVGLLVKQPNKKVIQSILSFGGAYVLGISVLHIMPEVFYHSSYPIGLWVIGGFFVQLVLEQFSKGVEHAHIHAKQGASNFFAIQIMIGLCLHAFLEGMPFGLEEHAGHAHEGHSHGTLTDSLLLGIVLHKIPAAFALVLILVNSGFAKKTALLCLTLFAFMSPLGGLFGQVFPWTDSEIFTKIMAVVLGSFLHIATTILFEVDGDSHHNISLRKLSAILLGIFLSIITII